MWTRDERMHWSRKKGKRKEEVLRYVILDLGNEVRSSVEQGMTAMEKLVEKLGNTEDRVECKKLKKGLEEARFSNTFLHMQNERVERDLYWTKAHEFYQKMIQRGFVCRKLEGGLNSFTGRERSLDNNTYVEEYDCSSLALD
ncbi:hypothetical protein Tco_0668707 [Tanacetum coccineum]